MKLACGKEEPEDLALVTNGAGIPANAAPAEEAKTPGKEISLREEENSLCRDIIDLSPIDNNFKNRKTDLSDFFEDFDSEARNFMAEEDILERRFVEKSVLDAREESII